MAQVYISLAKLDQRLGNVTAARKVLRAAVERTEQRATDERRMTHQRKGFAEWAKAFNEWAALERDVGNLTGALAVLERARALFPRDSSLLQTLGTVERMRGQRKAARAAFQDACAIDGKVAAYVAWALLEAEEGNLTRARELFAMGAAVDPSHGPLYNAHARVEFSHGNVDTARTILLKAIKRKPMSDLWHGLGRLEESRGDLATAERVYREGAELALPGEETEFLWHSLGSVLLAQKKLEEALEAFSEGLQRKPYSSQLLVRLEACHGDTLAR